MASLTAWPQNKHQQCIANSKRGGYQQNYSLGGTRTRSFLIRSQTRYYCATREEWSYLHIEMEYVKYSLNTKRDSLGGTRTRSFLIRSQTRYHCATRDHICTEVFTNNECSDLQMTSMIPSNSNPKNMNMNLHSIQLTQ